MYLFWLLNSGVFAIFYLSLGEASALFVAYVFHNRFALIKDVRSANWDIVKRVLNPSMPIFGESRKWK